MKLIIMVALLIHSVGLLAATNAWSLNTHNIKAIYLYSNQESVYPSHKGVLQVQFANNIAWGNNSDCSTTSVLVRNEDTHIISALLSAKLSSSSVRLYADTDVKLGSECYLRAMGLI